MSDLAVETSWVYSSGLDSSTGLGWTEVLGTFCNSEVLIAHMGVLNALFRAVDYWVLSCDSEGRQIRARVDEAARRD